MLIANRRLGAIASLLGLLGGGLVLALAPMHAGEIRVGGVSVLWWYAAVIAPVVAGAVTLFGLVRRTR